MLLEWMLKQLTTGLFLSARAEALINQQPGVAGYQAADTQYSQALATIGRQGDAEPRDLLDAIVCGAIISFGLRRPEAVVAQLGSVLDGASRHPQGTGMEAWTAVRVLQGELVKGEVSYGDQARSMRPSHKDRSISGIPWSKP